MKKQYTKKSNKPNRKITRRHSSNKICIRLILWYFRDCLKQGKAKENLPNILTRPSKIPFLSKRSMPHWGEISIQTFDNIWLKYAAWKVLKISEESELQKHRQSRFSL